jgi:hypothetical protein
MPTLDSFFDDDPYADGYIGDITFAGNMGDNPFPFVVVRNDTTRGSRRVSSESRISPTTISSPPSTWSLILGSSAAAATYRNIFTWTGIAIPEAVMTIGVTFVYPMG